MKKLLFTVLLSLSSAMADGCWDLKEESELSFDELSEKITFSVKNAVTCEPVQFADVNFGGVTLQTDGMGTFSIALDSLNEDQAVKASIKAKKYITLYKKFRVEAGSIRGNKILLSPDLPVASIRFVLTWADKPRDMDLHLISEDFHVSYQDTKNVRNKARLNRDAKRGFGPETITLEKVNPNKTYTLYVNRYSRKGKINSKAEVAVYMDNRLKRVIKLPHTSLKAVKILTFKNDKAHYINEAINEVP